MNKQEALAALDLTDYQKAVLKKSWDDKSGAIPIISVKGCRTLFGIPDLIEELSVEGECVKGLFDKGLLEWSSSDTARLTAKGKALAETVAAEINAIIETEQETAIPKPVHDSDSDSNRKITSIVAFLISMTFICEAAPSITSVTAQPQSPWNGKVNISYTVSGDVAATAKQNALIASLKVTATDRDANRTYTTTSLSGDTSLANGTHAIVWDMAAQGLTLQSANVAFSVSCEMTPATYCVIDLSAGSSASSYPVTYLASPPSGGFNVDAYKTTKLVLKRMEAGSFIMGKDQTVESHRVTLTKPFHIGLFEMTQTQYQLVTGSNPSTFSGDKRPVEQVSYNVIRGSSSGAGWPGSSAVDSTSFLGKLRTRTGLNIDLPTEAQWEYACRAGTTTKYSYGDSINGSYMWYADNSWSSATSSSQTHDVGTKSPNPWGLYDMHGNVWEWCLDWHGTLFYGTDPKGSSSGSKRVVRGGSWHSSTDSCTSYYQYSLGSSGEDYYSGFRLAWPLAATSQATTISGGSAPIPIPPQSTISFDRQGGTGGSASVTATYGSAMPAITVPTRTGHTFGGYYTAANGGGTQYYSTSGASARNWDKDVATTLYAKWTVNTYAVTLDRQGGTGGSASVTATYGLAMPAIVLPTRTGYTFGGYYTAANGGGTQYYTAAGASARSWDKDTATTLYAKWWRPDAPAITPAGGVVANWPLSITMSCATEGAAIHYTTNGSEPTAGSTLYSRFRITGRTTVKAVAIKDGLASEVAVAEYAAGQCADPVITPANGTSFEHVNQPIAIAWQGEDGVLRYTTDGSDPTTNSPAYGGPFTIDNSTVVKAKAFGDQFFDSAIVTASLTRVWVNVATPVITAASSFTGSETKVEISCATGGASIRYTLNGNDPNSHATRYTGPFYVTDSCTVKAYAMCYDYLDSAVATQSIEKVWGVGDTVGAPDHAFSTGGDLPFVRVTDNTAPLGESMKSGAITHGQQSTLSTTVMGPGTISFQWKTSCEKDPDDLFEWDHAEFWVDGTRIAQLDGETAWQTVTQAISGSGFHTLLWKYVKDDVESEGEDCCWVADYHWASAYTATQTTEVPVPYIWLRGFFPHTPDEYDAYESVAKETAANGVNKVWECYVAGLNPTNATDVFRAVISMENGKPVIGWTPDLNEGGTKQERVYIVEGRPSLTEGDWEELRIENGELRIGDCRFFRVKVTLP